MRSDILSKGILARPYSFGGNSDDSEVCRLKWTQGLQNHIVANMMNYELELYCNLAGGLKLKKCNLWKSRGSPEEVPWKSRTFKDSKSTFYWNSFEWSCLQRVPLEWWKEYQKTLIMSFVGKYCSIFLSLEHNTAVINKQVNPRNFRVQFCFDFRKTNSRIFLDFPYHSILFPILLNKNQNKTGHRKFTHFTYFGIVKLELLLYYYY